MLYKFILEKLDYNSQEEYDIYYYGLTTLIHTILTGLTIFTIAYLLGVLKWSLIIASTASVLRSFSGGGHSKSPITCTVLSVVLINIFALLINRSYLYINEQTLLIITGFIILLGFMLVNKYAPADTPQNPITNIQFKKQLRKRSYLFLIMLEVIVLFSFYNKINGVILSILAGLLWQLFTLTPYGYNFLHKIDSLVEKAKKGIIICIKKFNKIPL